MFRSLTRAVVLILILSWLMSLGAVMLWERRDDARAADAIVVLGAGQYDGRPSPVLKGAPRPRRVALGPAPRAAPRAYRRDGRRRHDERGRGRTSLCGQAWRARQRDPNGNAWQNDG